MICKKVPQNGSTRVSGVGGSAKSDHSIKHTFSRATSAPEGLLKIKDVFSRAGSASFCTHFD